MRDVASEQTDVLGERKEPLQEEVDFKSVSLGVLCEHIAKGSAAALDEFLTDRPVFTVPPELPEVLMPWRLGPPKALLFGPYVELIRDKTLKKGWWRPKGTEFIDRSVELLIARFTNLPSNEAAPDSSAPEENHEDAEVDGCNVDRRVYFRSFIAFLKKHSTGNSVTRELERERREAFLMQGFLWRQFFYCLQEAGREANPLMNRYAWDFGSGRIIVWFPKSFGGRPRKLWLEEHIGQPDLTTDGELERIQALIDEHFGRQMQFSIDEHFADRLAGSLPPPDAGLKVEDGVTMRHLIAHEKAAEAKKLPRAIRSLGYDRIVELVITILDNIVSELHSDLEIARHFGLSTATFSRFAGRQRWNKWRKDHENPPPHLAVNSARILKKHRDFIETAREMGLIDAKQDDEVEQDAEVEQADEVEPYGT
jgi:hypothetical protein